MYIGAAEWKGGVSGVELEADGRRRRRWKGDGASRGEVAAIACQDCDVDVFSGSDFAHPSCEYVIEILGEGIELFWEVEGNEGDFAVVGQEDWIGHRG